MDLQDTTHQPPKTLTCASHNLQSESKSTDDFSQFPMISLDITQHSHYVPEILQQTLTSTNTSPLQSESTNTIEPLKEITGYSVSKEAYTKRNKYYCCFCNTPFHN